MGEKDKWTRGTIPTSQNGSGPCLIDPARTAAHLCGYAVVKVMKLLAEEAGEIFEFGTAIILNNDGSGQKTKRHKR